MKTGNEYVDLLEAFDATPKAVYAAVAVSLANRLGVDLVDADKAINDEWAILHQARIIPQKPPKSK